MSQKQKELFTSSVALIGAIALWFVKFSVLQAIAIIWMFATISIAIINAGFDLHEESIFKKWEGDFKEEEKES